MLAACSDDDGGTGKADSGDGTGGERGNGGRSAGGSTATGGRSAGGSAATGGRGAGGTTASGGTTSGGSPGTGGSNTSTDAGADASRPPADGGLDGALPDPPGAAAVITVVPATGSTCVAPHGELQIPRDQRIVGRLTCDLSTGCKPDEFTITSATPNSSVECSVAPTGDSYAVSASLSHNGDTVTLTGTVSSTGGTVLLTHFAALTQVTLQGECTLSAPTNHGEIGPGKLWAQLSCPGLKEPLSGADDHCKTFGSILFENCTK